MKKILNIAQSIKRLLALSACLIGCVGPTWALQDGFVYVDEVVVPGVVVDLRYRSSNNFVGRPVDGYEGDRAILSRPAATALAAVQADLKVFSLGIKIFDAYRPQRAVDHFVRWARDINDNKMKAEYYPDVDKQNLFKEDYIAERSGHSRGSTVDLTLVDLAPSHHPLDMGTSFDFFAVSSWPDYPGLKPQQRANRMLLQVLMAKHGFRPYPKEWWHFTLNAEPYPDTYFNFAIE